MDKPIEQKGAIIVENPFYRPQIKQPPPPTWWQRFFLRRWIRNIVGVTDDMANGTLYMQLTTSNIEQLTRLVQGLRTDINAANDQQNPVNDVVIELERRLHYYESKQGSALHEQYKEILKMDAKEQQRKEREAAYAQLEAANARIAQRKLAIESGEFIECSACNGSGYTDDGQDTCPSCEGGGVVPNPEYVPPSEFNDDGVKKHLHLEG